jgi:sn-glycerol 3-phosphate transport system permease protein
MLVPLEATMVVNRRTIGSLDWLNTYQGLAIPFAATAFGTFLVRQALLTMPRDLRDAARIDGAGHLSFIRHVAVPLLRPTLGALALFSFLSAWNQYLWPNLITTEADMNTVQSGLRSLREGAIQQPNLVMAGTIIAAIPIVIALLIFQKALVRGLTAGAVKG